MLSQKHSKFIFPLNLALAFTEGLFVLWSFIKEPSEPGSAVLFGFSYLRLILILIVLFLLIALFVLLISSFWNSAQVRVSEKFLLRLAKQKGIFWIFTLWMGIAYVLLFVSERELGFLASYRERLFPIIVWLAILSVQFCFIIFYFQGINSKIFSEYRTILIPSLVVLIAFALLLLFIKLTHLGLTPDLVYWQEPGAPILFYQVLFAAFIGVLFYLFIEGSNFGKSYKLDWIVFLSVWGLACFLWLSQPAKLTWFSVEPTPPNYQIYPFSDALVYDNTAREFLIGKPIPSDFWSKPFYSFFLAILHLLTGGNYSFSVALQVIFLAAIPAFAYLLMARLHAKPAGLILALLLILREHNALALSNVIQVSHVKLLLSDVFAMGFMVLLLWLFFHWAEKPAERRVMPLVLGGVFSLLILTRGHPILLLPFILCAVLFTPFPRSSLRWEALALTLVGFLIPLLPWFWHNYELTGKLAFQSPVSPYSTQMSAVYSFTPSVLDPRQSPSRDPGESDLAYNDRLQKEAFQFVLEHPDQVAKFLSAHYFHNSIFSYIYLPYSFQVEGIREYVKQEPFWGSWMGELSFQGWILLFIHISVIALGFGYLWKQHRYLAFVPLLFGIGYNFSVSIGRLSGWRFILPADWITLIYYAVGLMQLYYVLRSLANQEVNLHSQEHEVFNVVQPLGRTSLIGSALTFLVIGIMLTKGQELFSHRYPAKSASQLENGYSRMTNGLPATNINLDNFLKTDGAVIVYGQALYPSFFTADQDRGDESWPVYYFWPGYKPKSFSRLVFNLNGPRPAGVILPMASPPSSFPDGSDVIVIGCLAESGEINALAVLLQGAPPVQYIREPFPAPVCPLTEPN